MNRHQQELLERINVIEQKLDTVLMLLEPVHAHAGFVGDLKDWCYNKSVLRAILPPRQENTSPAQSSETPVEDVD